MEWRIRVADGEYVAPSTEVLQEWFLNGRVRAEHYVFHPLLEKWMYAAEVQELRTAVPAAMPVDQSGAWCPNCRNRNSYKTTEGVGWAIFIIVIISCGLGLLMIPFLPKTWHCTICGHQWRA
jgi:hypothetical protein